MKKPLSFDSGFFGSDFMLQDSFLSVVSLLIYANFTPIRYKYMRIYMDLYKIGVFKNPEIMGFIDLYEEI